MFLKVFLNGFQKVHGRKVTLLGQLTKGTICYLNLFCRINQEPRRTFGILTTIVLGI